ncbi:MAG: hypothetical protein WBG57_14045 [Ornithinimicrobium sp.]
MSTPLVRPAGIFLLVLTLFALGIAGMREPSSATPGAPVAGLRDAESVDRMVLVGAPGLTWSDINESTPTLQALAADAISASVVMEHRTPVPCATEAWLSLGAVAVVPGSASAITDGRDSAATDPRDCRGESPPDLETQTASVEEDGEDTEEADESERPDIVRLADFDAWQEAWSKPPRQVALGSLATGLRAEGQCLAAYGPLAALASSDRTGVLGRFDPSPLDDLNLRRVVGGRNACPVLLIDARGSDSAGLDARVARMTEVLQPNSLLIVAGMPGGNATSTGAQEATRPVLILRTGPDGEASDRAATLWSRSTQTPGVVAWPDLSATILTNANVPVTADMGGHPLTAPPSPEGDRLDENQQFSAAITLADRAQRGVAITWAVLFALALGAASAWLVYAPPATAPDRSRPQHARGPLSLVGLAMATLPVATLCASWLPWWRWGVDLDSADVTTVGMFRTNLALILLTAIFGAVILVAAWGAYRLIAHHPLIPVAVVAAVTVIVVGSDAATGGGLAMRSVLGAHEITSSRFYGLTSVPFGLLSTAVLLLGGCIASLCYLRSGHGYSAPRGQWLGLFAVVSLGLSTAAIIGSDDWGADPGGVLPMLIGTLLLSVAAAGRRLSPSVIFLLGIIAVATLGVIAFADWLQPESSRGTGGRVIEVVVNGNAIAILGARLDRVAGVLLDGPSSWLIVLLLALAVYAVTARRTAIGGRLLPIWDQHLMRATGGALLATCIIGWVLNDSGLAAVAAALTIAYGAALSIAARGRPALANAG